MMRRLLPLGILSPVVPLLLLYALMQTAVAEAPRLAVGPGDRFFLSASPSQTASATLQIGPQAKEDPLEYDQTILLWPKALSGFVNEYASWSLWLESVHLTRYAARDELLVSVRAIASQVPDLTVETDEPDSDLIVVSGNVGALWALIDRLRGHPLLARITEDAQLYRDQARTAWEAAVSTPLPENRQRVDVPLINIRGRWAANLVWGAATPEASVTVTITGDGGQARTTTVQANADGLYQAYFAWDICAGDTVEIQYGAQSQRVAVPVLGVVTDRPATRVSGQVSPTGDRDALEVVVAHARRSTLADREGHFSTDFSSDPFRAGDPGFVSCTDKEGIRFFQPFSVNIVRVRRDTSWGLYGDTHSMGISSIVRGSATANATVTITLTRPGQFVLTRTVITDNSGNFTVSVDRLIQDGDLVEVSDGANVTAVPVATLTYEVDAASKVIRGQAPPGITSMAPGTPHSLLVTIGGYSYPITTTAEGEFETTLADNPYIAGLLGAMRYTTPEGDEVCKPLFAADPLVRGEPGDGRADVIIGQPDFSQITPNELADNRVFNPGGVYVDRSVEPNRIYVYDAGNSRVLGLSHLGECMAGMKEGQDCTTDSDCPGSTCQIQEARAADIVLGQPSFETSACNGDSGYQLYPDVPNTDADSVCGLREEQTSISEGWSGATMVADDYGNLYVTDVFNNRVLRYDSPFATDGVADYVWGQADFSGIHCNRGAGFSAQTDGRSLCLAARPGYSELQAGVALDSAGNLWVADQHNNRVLRFPFYSGLGRPSVEADLVLGQPGFSTTTSGSGLDQMNKPASVRVSTQGAVYVADSRNSRVLVFEPPILSGMPASGLLDSGLAFPMGLEFDLNGGIWVNDLDLHAAIHFVDGSISHTVPTGWLTFGGMGVDADDNLMIAFNQQAQHYSSPTYSLDAVFLKAEPSGGANKTGPQGLAGGLGLEVAAGQLIYSDWSRLLYWNAPWDLTSYEPADGVVGEPDFYSRRGYWIGFGRMRADSQGRLWVISGGIRQENRIIAYQLPLVTEAEPIYSIGSPLSLKGGGSFNWGTSLFVGGIDVQPDCDCLWLSDEDNNRVFRINHASTAPVVDVVLGQLSASGTQCNQGRGKDYPSQDSLCHPGALSFDRSGNLWVADHNLEFDGNYRLLEYDASIMPSEPSSAVFGIPATRVFGRDGDFTEPDCLPLSYDPMCAPWEPAFDSQGRMVIGFNAYAGRRFLMMYQDPLNNPLPVAALGDYQSMPLSARFDQFDNLYVIDHNRNRILIYRDHDIERHNIYLPVILRTSATSRR